MRKKKGLFITVEGGDGSGKSTQAVLLARHLKKMGYPVRHTREPGGTPFAESLRDILLKPGGYVAPLAELFLYEAARAQHVAEVIRPTLDKGGVVVCERFCDATTAYQGWGRGLSVPLIERLNEMATASLKPDITFLLDVAPQDGLRRVARRGNGTKDRLERESTAFHERVRRGYLALAKREPKRFRVVPWREGIDRVQNVLRQEVDKRLGGKKR